MSDLLIEAWELQKKKNAGLKLSKKEIKKLKLAFELGFDGKVPVWF